MNSLKFFVYFCVWGVHCMGIVTLQQKELLTSSPQILPLTDKNCFIANHPELQEKHCAARFSRRSHLKNLIPTDFSYWWRRTEGMCYLSTLMIFNFPEKLLWREKCFKVCGKRRPQHWFWFCPVDEMWAEQEISNCQNLSNITNNKTLFPDLTIVFHFK